MDAIVGDSWWVDTVIGQSAVIMREDDIQPATTLVCWLSYLLGQPTLVQIVPEVGRIRQKKVLKVKIQVASEDELCIERERIVQVLRQIHRRRSSRREPGR